MAKKDESKKKVGSTGLETNVAGTLAYSLGLVTGLLFLIVEKEDKEVKFHAMQAILANLVAIAVNWLLWISIIGIVLVPIWGIVVFVVWIMLMVRTYRGEKWILPLVGQVAEEQTK